MTGDRISRQLKVDKVYIEVQRDRDAGRRRIAGAGQKILPRPRRARGRRHGAVGRQHRGQFRSFCYTEPGGPRSSSRARPNWPRGISTKSSRTISSSSPPRTTRTSPPRATRSWTQFRLDLMDEAAENLIVKPARAVNPKVKIVIKFPNWYEHFQGLGYDLDQEPKMFDGIYTGTETRDPVITDQHLQQYESYQIIRYFENIAPGRQRRRLGGHLQHPLPRPLRRAALGHDVRQGAGNDAVQLVGACCSPSSPATARPGRICTRASITTRCCSPARPTPRPDCPSPPWPASPATPWNRWTRSSASSATPSASPATSRINPPARISCTIISA